MDNNTDALRSLSFDLDSNDRPHIAYINIIGDIPDSSSGWINHYYYGFYEGTWNIELIDSGTEGISYVSLALDQSDNPHIAYTNVIDTIQELVYLHVDNNTWHAELIDEGFASHLIAIDSNNNPAIMYSVVLTDGGIWDGKYSVRYAYMDAQWTIKDVYEVIGGASFGYLTFAFDSNNNPHAFFPIRCLGDTWDSRDIGLNYLYHDTQWEHVLLDFTWGCSVSGISNMALDSNDQPWIAYYMEDSLNLVSKSDSGWETRFTDKNASYVTSISLAMDSLDRPHLVYSYRNDEFEPVLVYAYREKDWEFDIVATNEKYSFSSVSIKLDSKGSPHIVYTESLEKILYARWTEEDVPDPEITSVSPKTLYDVDNSSLTIYGNNFTEEEVFVRLTRDGEDDIRSRINSTTENMITCVFDLKGATPGLWNVVVYNSVKQFCVLENAVTIVAGKCLIENLVQNEEYLKVLRKFRDDILKEIPNGKNYIKAYYHHTGELKRVFLSDRELRREFTKLVKNIIPVMKSILNTKQITFSNSQKKEIIIFLDMIYKKSSPDFQSIIEKARMKIENGNF